MTKITKLLIANRGEIAVRIIKTCQKLGIKTVAIYSDPDYQMPFVRLSDEAYSLGGTVASESYINTDKVLKAIKDTNADAVHPGYGFLSENAKFANLLEKEKITFVGPNSKAIDSMGDKINSKAIAESANVNTVPGCQDVIRDGAHAIEVAKQIGLPVIMKASAGGGGKGIRIVREGDDVAMLFESVQNEGRKSFGDDRIFIEKFIENPRHIEIQVVADKHGNVVCLGERECSIQRNNQKVIEEAPSAFVTEEMRQKMYAQSVALVKKVGYDSVGTIEYVVSQNREFYFLEMNTRLQVEHPVTEYVTGFDLVEIMLRIAQGEKLWFTQNDVKITGHAFESRICAEDPASNFMPSVGRISTYIEPVEDIAAGIRVDSGIRAGLSVTPYYDSMIAKLITYGQTREEARQKAMQSLNRFVIEGLKTNISFVQELYKHKRFIEGNISTLLIKQEYPDGFKYEKCVIDDEILRIFSYAALVLYHKNVSKLKSISGAYTNPIAAKQRKIIKNFRLFVGDLSAKIDICTAKMKGFVVNFQNTECEFDYNYELGDKVMEIIHSDGTKSFIKILHNDFCSFKLAYNGLVKTVFLRNSRTAGFYEICKNNISPTGNITELESPLTGIITNIHAHEGDEIRAGIPIVTIEAMKMENAISVESDVKIKKINCKQGMTVSIGDILIEFE